MRTQIPPKYPAYTYLKGNVYYFSRAIPADLKNYYSKPRVIQSLRTTSRRHAVHSSRLLSVRLEDYWHDLRLRNTEPPCAHLLTRENLQGQLNSYHTHSSIRTLFKRERSWQGRHDGRLWWCYYTVN
jgi:hypothetical protein